VLYEDILRRFGEHIWEISLENICDTRLLNRAVSRNNVRDMLLLDGVVGMFSAAALD